jgi:lysophospholipase L1-like esterase
MPPAATVTGAADTVRSTVNTWLRANYATFADGLVDLAADSRLTNTADTTYYVVDGVHYNAAGNAVWAELIGDAFEVLYPTASRPTYYSRAKVS